MKKEYALNIKYINSDSDWNDSDNADWYESWSDAFETAEEAFADEKVEEVMLSVWVDGEIENNPLHMVREDGDIYQYQNGERLWV